MLKIRYTSLGIRYVVLCKTTIVFTMDKVRQQSHLLQTLSDPKVHTSVKSVLCSNGPLDLINVLCACGVNVLCGNCNLTVEQTGKLKKFRNFIYKLADTNQTARHKRKLLVNEVRKSDSCLMLLLPIVLDFVNNVQ